MRNFSTIINFFLFFATLAIHQSAFAQWWNPLEPRNLEDCILQGMKGVTSDQAARAIERACRTKFGDKSVKPPPSSIDCDVTWDGFSFKKGKPTKENQAIRYGETFTTLYFPSSMPESELVKLIKNNTSRIEELCR